MNRLRLAALVGADITALRFLWPDWPRLAADAGHPAQWFAASGADRSLAQAASAGLWLVAAWFGISLGIAVGATLPGRVGSVLDGLARFTVPTRVRRLVVSAATAATVLAPVPALATPVATAPAQSEVSAHATQAFDWPTDATSAAPNSPTQPHEPRVAATDAPDAATPAHQGVRIVDTAHLVNEVTVANGDSLWAITAHEIGPDATDADIAQAWPRLYAANRAAIGSDPSLVLPGTTLTIPTPEDTP